MVNQEKERTVTKDMLVGMGVIDAEGHLIGTVKDVAFTIGRQGISLYVETKKGESKNISWEDVQAAGDYILLKPQPIAAQPPSQAPSEQRVCPTCKGPLSFIQQYQRWYCYKCQKYA